MARREQERIARALERIGDGLFALAAVDYLEELRTREAKMDAHERLSPRGQAVVAAIARLESRIENTGPAHR